jgi:steroid delta-isomerase-like uncharacterized protein
MSDLKALYRRYIEHVWNEKNIAAMDDYFSDDIIDHAAPPGQEPGLAGLKGTFAMFFEAFPDLHVTLENQVVEGDTVVARITLRGTHRGPFFGIPATGRRIERGSMHLLRCANGKMVEHWGYGDDLGLMNQLGAIQMLGQ